MPYSAEHKEKTRARIVECAHRLFNRHGLAAVSIDDIMESAGLTRGGFYNHFRAKEDLYAETLTSYAKCRQADSDRCEATGPDAAIDLVNRYISREHLDDIDANCPLMALPTDIAHAGPAAREAYRQVLEAMVGFFEANLEPQSHLTSRQRALALSAICVGAMVLARTIDDEALKDDICDAARAFAHGVIAEAQ